MKITALPDPRKLTIEDAITLVRGIQEALWVENRKIEPDKEWSADTLDEIAFVMQSHGMAVAE